MNEKDAQSREQVYEESICVAVHLLDHGKTTEARDELLGALPRDLTKTYRDRADQDTYVAVHDRNCNDYTGCNSGCGWERA